MNRHFFENIQRGTLLFSRFEAIQCLSASDCGAVYLCCDLVQQCKRVALKIVSTEGLSDIERMRSLHREMLLAGLVNHPNVVRTQSFFQDQDFSAFTMEFFNNGTLRELLEQPNALAFDEVRGLIEQLIAGLEAIHAAGIVHRDLKPENILRDADGTLKIADFSIAAPAGEFVCSQAVEQHLVGTMNYLSPEYIERGQIDVRTDIYALGVVAYELVTGRLPFEKRSLIESLTSRVRFDPERPDRLRRDCPIALSNWILKALQRDPSQRFQTASEMRVALDACMLAPHTRPVSAKLEHSAIAKLIEGALVPS